MKIPYVKQINDWFCGPACAQMILASAGFSYSQKDLAKQMGTSPYHGTNRKDLVDIFRKYDFVMKKKIHSNVGDLRRALAQNYATLVNYIEPTDDIGHYAIVMEVTSTHIVLRDPWNGPNFRISIRDFVPRWHGMHVRSNARWMLAVKPS